jgi:hypothetical protein
MRRFPFAAAAIVLACAACSKESAKAPPTPVEAASTPVAAAPPPAPPPPTDTATPATPAAAPASEPAPVAAAAPPSPTPERVVRFVPAKERRIHALVNNAVARDVTGHTEQAAAMWESRRAACKTQACVDRAYAAQESELRKWEGSEAIR